MNCKVLGIGAAGNKAAIALVENGVIDLKDILLINSTLRDVPDNYKSKAIQFSNTSGGCGKEREVAKKLCLQSINDSTLDRLDSIMDPEDRLCIIVNSSEGGTGCGSAPMIAKYMREVVGTNVHMFVFTGFEEDGRGLKNTVEYFQELNENYTVEAISNSRFLGNGTTKPMAEKKANMEFVNRVKVLLGRGMIDSEQNIDETDQYKVITTPGFMTIEHIELEERIKNIDTFNKIITEAIDNSKSLEISDLSAKRIGVIMNVSDRSREFIDYGFNVIKERYGVPFEVFTHLQYNGETEYIDFIISGMNLPLEEVQRVYKRYQELSSAVNKSKDNFLEQTKNMVVDQSDAVFDMIVKKEPPVKKAEDHQEKKKSFLSDFESKWEEQMNAVPSFLSEEKEEDSTEEEQRKRKEEFLNQF